MDSRNLRLEGDARSEFVEGRISLKLGGIQVSDSRGRLQWTVIISKLRHGFPALQEFAFPVSRNTCWFVFCPQMREQSGGGEAIGFSVERAQVSPGIWPHFQLNYICLTSSTWIHRTGHMGITAASSEPELNLVHYNIMSKEEKLYLAMIAQLNCVSEGFCINQLEFPPPPQIHTDTYYK